MSTKQVVFYLTITYVASCMILSVHTACTSTIECTNGGQFDNSTCSCVCLPAYSGLFCEKADCAKESVLCGSFYRSTDCSSDTTRYNCPKMCNMPICKCGTGGCINGGTFKPDDCSCTCPLPFAGKICEDCKPDPDVCGTSDFLCMDDSFKKLCPKLCKLAYCENRRAQCPQVLQCQNSAKFNEGTCKCDCFPNYNGDNCENLICSNPEPSECGTLDCSIPTVKDYCPNKCSKCSSNSSTTALTTTTSANCAPKRCLNGAKFNTDRCKCECLPSYSGDLCETLKCEDPARCSEIAKADCDSDFLNNYCPVFCGKCDSTTTGSSTTGSSTTGSSTTDSSTTGSSTTGSSTTDSSTTDSSTTGSSTTGSSTTGSSTTGSSTTGSSTTDSTTTASAIGCTTALECENDFIFDFGACECACGEYFTGSLCENFDCINSPPDPAECDNLSAADICDFLANTCPRKCLCERV